MPCCQQRPACHSLLVPIFKCPGLDAPSLIKAFDEQVASILDQLHAHNVTNFLDLPDGVRVASLRRIEQPEILPFELQRAS